MKHRHVWPNGQFSNWHDASVKHTKPEYANDTEFEVQGEEKVDDERHPTPIRKDLGEDPEATRALYKLERI